MYSSFQIDTWDWYVSPYVLAAPTKDLALMRPQALIAIALIVLSIAGCSRTAPIYNVYSAPMPDPSEHLSEMQAKGATENVKSRTLSAEQVRGAVMEAASDNGWIVMEDDPCRLILKLVVNRHRAFVSVDYSATTYSITYEDSVLLMHDGTNIHRNYNLWVKNLQDQIDRRLAEWMILDRRASPGSGGAQMAC